MEETECLRLKEMWAQQQTLIQILSSNINKLKTDNTSLRCSNANYKHRYKEAKKALIGENTSSFDDGDVANLLEIREKYNELRDHYKNNVITVFKKD